MLSLEPYLPFDIDYDPQPLYDSIMEKMPINYRQDYELTAFNHVERWDYFIPIIQTTFYMRMFRGGKKWHMRWLREFPLIMDLHDLVAPNFEYISGITIRGKAAGRHVLPFRERFAHNNLIDEFIIVNLNMTPCHVVYHEYNDLFFWYDNTRLFHFIKTDEPYVQVMFNGLFKEPIREKIIQINSYIE